MKISKSKLKLLLNKLMENKIPNDIKINKNKDTIINKNINNSFISENILNYIYNTIHTESYTISSSNLTINIISFFQIIYQYLKY
jgi:hypothetical protein